VDRRALGGAAARRWQDDCGVRAACKPGSVLDRGRGVIIHLGRALLPVSRNLPERSPRRKGCVRKRCRSYSVLLPVGFAMPSPLPTPRCALTAPFHPDPQIAAPSGPAIQAGGLLSVALSLGLPPPGVTRHRFTVEPGLSSPHSTAGGPAGCRERSPGCHTPACHVGEGRSPDKRATASIRPIV